MVDTSNVTFPITGKALAALQREQVGRKLTPWELDLFFEIADMANEAYAAATVGDPDTVQRLLDDVNAIPAPDPCTRHLSALCRGWVLLGCQKGTEQLKKTIDAMNNGEEGKGK